MSVIRNLIFVNDICITEVGERNQGWPEGSFFNSYYTEM